MLCCTRETSWWHFYVSGNLYQFNINGIVKAINASQQSFNYNLNGNTAVDIGKKIKFQWDFSYLSRTVTSQGEDGELFLSNAGIKYIHNSKLSGELLLQNIFNSNHQRFTTSSNDFYVTTNYFKYDRVLQFNISCRFNDPSKKNKSIKTEYGEKDF